MLAGAVCYFLGTVVSSNMLAIVLLSLGLTFGCITLVLGPAILMELVSKNHQGKIQGWFMAFTSLGGIAGPYITGYLIENASSQGAGFHYSFQLCALVLTRIWRTCVGGCSSTKDGYDPTFYSKG